MDKFPGAIRFSRLSDGDMEESRKKERLASLEAEAWACIKRGKQANIAIGRVFNQLKDMVGHGRWGNYYKEKFGFCGIAERTAQTYMEMASKSAEPADLGRKVGPRAQEVIDADEAAKKKQPLKPQVYKLALRLTIEQQNEMEALRKSKDWSTYEQRIVAELMVLAKEAHKHAADEVAA